jgi:hypothetical protein
VIQRPRGFSNRALRRRLVRFTQPLGKAPSSKNAFRHGLNIPVWRDPTLSALAEEIALRIAGPDAGNERMEQARRKSTSCGRERGAGK